MTWLDMAETQRHQRIQSIDGKRQFALCRSALRASLIKKLDCKNDDLRFSDSRESKPFAIVCGERVNQEFNVTHSYRHALLALSEEGKVGIDVEERVARYDISGEITKAFSPTERKALGNTLGKNRTLMFFRIWTIKESLIKAIGEGFRYDTSSFTIPEQLIYGARRANFRFPHAPEQEWQIENLENDQFAASLTHESD